MYNWVPVKPKEEVCRERAIKAASLKHDEKILELHNKWLETKQGKYFAEKQFEDFIENYEVAEDKYIRDEDKKRLGGRLKKASDILLEALGEI